MTRGPDITGDLTAPWSEHLGQMRKSLVVVNGRRGMQPLPSARLGLKLFRQQMAVALNRGPASSPGSHAAGASSGGPRCILPGAHRVAADP